MNFFIQSEIGLKEIDITISFLKNMFSLFGAQNQKLTKICSK